MTNSWYKTRTIKGYRHHYIYDQLVMRQPIWKAEDRWKQINPDYIDEMDLGHHGGHKYRPKLGNWYLSQVCDKPQRWGGSYFIQKTCRVSEPILFVLPCNAGVLSGNYFRGGCERNGFNNTWRAIDLMYRDIRDQFCLAAVDCLIYCSDVERSKMPGYNDGLGCLVFEWEMDRIKSEVDEGIPTQNVFKMNKKQDLAKKRGDALVLSDHIMVGLQRALDYGFQKIFAHLAPNVYRTAFCYAVERLGIWDRVCVVDFRSMMTGVTARKMFRYWYLNGCVDNGILDVRFLHRLTRSDEAKDIYPELKFWEYDAHHKNWESEVFAYKFAGPMIKSTQIVRKSDANRGEQHVRSLYNVPPNLLLEDHPTPLYGNAIKTLHQFD